MKYPKKLFLQIDKKNLNKKSENINDLIKFFSRNSLLISRKENDVRSGVMYKIKSHYILPDFLQIKLIRKDANN